MPLTLHKKIERISQATTEEIRLSSSLTQLVYSLYWELFQEEPCGGCSDKLNKYIQRIKSEGMKQTEQTPVSTEFILKEDVAGVPFNFGSKRILTHKNSTDQNVMEFLRINPNRIKLFKKFPANYQEMIDGDPGEALTGMKAPALIKKIQEITDEKILERILETESRVTVINAVEKRQEELTGASESNDNDPDNVEGA